MQPARMGANLDHHFAGPSFHHDEVTPLREVARINTGPCSSQGEINLNNCGVSLSANQATLRGCGKGNSDLFKPQAQFCNADFDQQGDTIKVLKEMIDHIATRGQEGINSDCSIMSDLHPFAQIAWQWVQPGRLDGKRYHLFTDGSCKDGRATWAFIAILETQKEGHVTFCRVGFAMFCSGRCQ